MPDRHKGCRAHNLINPVSKRSVIPASHPRSRHFYGIEPPQALDPRYGLNQIRLESLALRKQEYGINPSYTVCTRQDKQMAVILERDALIIFSVNKWGDLFLALLKLPHQSASDPLRDSDCVRCNGEHFTMQLQHGSRNSPVATW